MPMRRYVGSMMVVLVFASGGAAAQSDAQVVETAIATAATLCSGHSTERTAPGVRAVKVGSLRVLDKRGYAMCPDRRLDAAMPAVWYGAAGVFVWNPEVKGAIELVAGKIDAMARSEDFPPETIVWNADGSAATGAVVPAFVPRPRPAGS
jgi:hypothetical protein